MLEAMQEHQTTIGGEIYPLPEPFLVIATQNPIEQEGTYELPEAQMDRLLKEIVGAPEPQRRAGGAKPHRLGRAGTRLRGPRCQRRLLDEVKMLQDIASRIYVDAAACNYIVSLVYVTRNPAPYIGEEKARYPQVRRKPASLNRLLQAARAYALLSGRSYVVPEDVRSLRHVVLRHRVLLTFEAQAENIRSEEIIDAIFAAVLTP